MRPCDWSYESAPVRRARQCSQPGRPIFVHRGFVGRRQGARQVTSNFEGASHRSAFDHAVGETERQFCRPSLSAAASGLSNFFRGADHPQFPSGFAVIR
jgi:hypothetical protein